MKKCPFCGIEWTGEGPCPNCGMQSEKESRDDSLFRRPEGENPVRQPLEKEFSVEELFQPTPQAEPDQNDEKSSESPIENESIPDGHNIPNENEGITVVKSERQSMKLWQKVVAAVVLLAVIITAAVQLWSRPPVLPEDPAFYIQNDMLMSLFAGDEPQAVAEYSEAYSAGIDNTLQVSPDKKTFSWINLDNGKINVKSSGSEAVEMEHSASWYPFFSEDGKFLYYYAENENGEVILYQYGIETQTAQKVCALEASGNNYLSQDGLLAVSSGGQLTVYEEKTLSQKWSQKINAIPVSISQNKLYYKEEMEESYRLCCWNGNQTESLLEEIVYSYQLSNGTMYFLCAKDEWTPLSELIENDVSENELKEDPDEILVRSPQRTLYYFDGVQVHKLGDSMTINVSSESDNAIVTASLVYKEPEEVKKEVKLSSILQDLQYTSGTNIADYMESIWPIEAETYFVTRGKKLYQLPEDVPFPQSFKICGDWICLFTSYFGSTKGLWRGRLEGQEVISQESYKIDDLVDYEVTPDGTVYYWTGQSVGDVYKNGTLLAEDINASSIQVTDDGVLYYLGDYAVGGEGWTLNRYQNEEFQQLAQGVTDFVAYTQDYVLFLQLREDRGWDLYSSIGENTPMLVAENVDKLVHMLSLKPTPLIGSSIGGVDSYYDTDITIEMVN